MSHRTVSWTRLSRSLHDARPAIPIGLLGARAQVQFSTRRRPLVVAGQYDRAAIMVAAVMTAKGLQERFRLYWATAMSTALKATWQVARASRAASTH